MAKSEVIALLAEGGVLRGVRFAPRGHDVWTRTGGGVWPIVTDGTEAAPPPEAGQDGDVQGEVVESDRPLARAMS